MLKALDLVRLTTIFSVYGMKQTNFLVSLWYILKHLFASVSVKVVDTYLVTSTSMNRC